MKQKNTPQHKPQKSKTHPETEAAKTNEALSTGALSPSCSQNHTAHEPNPNKKLGFWHEPNHWIAVATVVMAVANIFYAWFAWRQITGANLDQRAWLGPIKMTLEEMSAPNPIVATVSINNSGKTPALATVLKIVLHPSDVPLNISDYAKHPVEQSETGPVPISVFPGVTIESGAATGSTDALGVENIRLGKKLLYLFGEITYRDVFKETHHTRFCAKYEALKKAFSGCGSYDFAD